MRSNSARTAQALAAILFGIWLTTFGSPAGATSFTVTAATDANPGVADQGAGVPGDLRWAILGANADGRRASAAPRRLTGQRGSAGTAKPTGGSPARWRSAMVR